MITALVNIIRRDKPGATLRLNYFLALFFGLIHGMGFSNYLKSMLGTQTNVVKPLLAFNLGLEFGQVLIVAVILLLAQIVVNPYYYGAAGSGSCSFLSAIFGSAFIMSIERLRELMH